LALSTNYPLKLFKGEILNFENIKIRKNLQCINLIFNRVSIKHEKICLMLAWENIFIFD